MAVGLFAGPFSQHVAYLPDEACNDLRHGEHTLSLATADGYDVTLLLADGAVDTRRCTGDAANPNTDLHPAAMVMLECAVAPPES